MLLTIEKILILKSVNIFSSVPEAQLADLATIVESVDYRAGETIIRQGELGTSMYIVEGGKCASQRRTTNLACRHQNRVWGTGRS